MITGYINQNESLTKNDILGLAGDLNVYALDDSYFGIHTMQCGVKYQMCPIDVDIHGVHHFTGALKERSKVFKIETDERDIVEILVSAIMGNKTYKEKYDPYFEPEPFSWVASCNCYDMAHLLGYTCQHENNMMKLLKDGECITTFTRSSAALGYLAREIVETRPDLEYYMA